MQSRSMLTTFDNPYDPFEQFTSWFLFDVEKGYDSCAYLEELLEPQTNYQKKKTIQKLREL